MDCRIGYPSGACESIVINEGDRGGDVADNVAARCGLPTQYFDMLYCGKKIQPDDLMCEAGMENGDFVLMRANTHYKALTALHKAEVTVTTNSLFRCIEEGKADCIRHLVEAGVSTNTVNEDGMTPVMLAAFEGDQDCVEVLIEKGFDIHKKTPLHGTALHAAATMGHSEISKLLVSNNVDVNPQRLPDMATPLHLAAMYGRVHCVNLLIFSGATVDAVNSNQETPLCVAASQNYVQVAISLIQSGADVNHPSRDHITPLHDAAGWGNTKLAELLITSGANIQTKDSLGCTALHHASAGARTETVSMLLASGADISAKSNEGQTALHMAGNGNCASELLANNANKLAVDNLGYTPLHDAAARADLSAVTVLLNAGCDPGTTSTEGETVLHSAVLSGDSDVIRCIVSTSLGSPALDKPSTSTGSTPLHYAASIGAMGTLRTLLSLGADVDLVDNNGYTPLHVAHISGHLAVAELLVTHGAAPLRKPYNFHLGVIKLKHKLKCC
eukprot:TRINITY_DN1984_c0_g1_i1.p1 TRINITY_DN1984_c0_g1~~TRINITY_DN1984_c0_g1_i1.p1  ORF type:complete len:502 (+),score=83.02 TRINITY_DN1984_c0_g1_i1:34-1539(+)